MKLHKKMIMILSVIMTLVILVSCNTTEEGLTFEFTGIKDITVEYGSEFNVLDGVEVKGSDGKDYTDRLTFTTTAKQVDRETGDVDTKSPGEIKVRYEIRVKDSLAQPWRTIVIETPERDDSKLLQNGDFSEGFAYWTVDQGVITETVKEGVLQLDVVGGSQPHEPRLFQMDIPFEKDVSYKISFEAKASDEKTINLQVGELLDNSPWFTDFKPGQQEHRLIEKEWKSFEYSFKQTLANDRGGLLFEFGPVKAGEPTEITIWLRNIEITITEDLEDIIPPIFTGVKNQTIELNEEFDPLKGVKANDNIDGDLTDQIEVIIKKDGEIVDEVVTTDVGIYEITYKVEDSSGNKAEETIIVTIESFNFDEENILKNGDFSNEESWGFWQQDWDDAPDAKLTIENNEANISATKFGDQSWSIQLFQENIPLNQNEVYKLSFEAKATKGRTINVTLGKVEEDEFIQYMESVLIDLNEEIKTYEIIIFVENTTTNLGKLVFELGNIGDVEASNITIKNVMLQKRAKEVLIDSDFNNEKHVIEQASDQEHATYEKTKDKLVININTTGEEPYIPHYYYIVDRLNPGTYKISFKLTGTVSRTLRFNIILPNQGYASILPNEFIDFKLVENEVFEFNQEFTVEEKLEEVKIELDFGHLVDGETNKGTFVLEDISLELK